MPKFIKKKSKKAGLPPGTLVHIGEKKTETSKITLIHYDQNQLQEKTLDTIEECDAFKGERTVRWVNVDGIHEVDVIEKIGKYFGLHPLTLEDIVNTGHRPKAEDFDDYIFIVMKMLFYDEEEEEPRSEQVSLVLGSDFLVSFQEAPGDVFDPVRDRIRKAKGRVRKTGSDYLAYTLIDAVVDNYFSVLELIGDAIESLEEDLLAGTNQDTLEAIHNMKQDMIYLRKQVWPLRELATSLTRDESSLISETTRVYLRDVHDHTVQIIDTIESFRDVLSGLLDLYMSTVSNKMNEVMKVLTIIATTFIPLTFIAGVYGMNFKYMPELEWHWGYFTVWGVMAVMVIGMLFYFRKRAWL